MHRRSFYGIEDSRTPENVLQFRPKACRPESGALNRRGPRALLLNALDPTLTLSALTVEAIELTGGVRVSAELRAPCRSDECLDQLVTRFSLEGGVSAVSWHVVAVTAT